MEKLMKNIVWIFTAVLFFVACTDDDYVTIKKDATTSLSLSKEAVVLSLETAEDEAIAFSWTTPDYGFDAAVSYVLNFEVAGNTSSLVVGKKLSKTFTGTELNELMLKLGAEADKATALNVYLTASVASVVTKSEMMKLTVTPYQTVFSPIYMTGAALGGWDWSEHYKIIPSTKPNIYTTLAYFIKGEAFRFFAQQNWGPDSYNYLHFSEVSDLLENANDGDKNFKVIGTSGWYRITVDLKAKKVIMEATTEPAMFMTGAALGGWDWNANFVKMTFVQEDVWVAETEFIQGEAFRFFAQEGWGPISYNYPYFSKVSEMFENANDGDQNFKCIKETGVYRVRINLNTKEVSIE